MITAEQLRTTADSAADLCRTLDRDYPHPQVLPDGDAHRAVITARVHLLAARSSLLKAVDRLTVGTAI